MDTLSVCSGSALGEAGLDEYKSTSPIDLIIIHSKAFRLESVRSFEEFKKTIPITMAIIKVSLVENFGCSHLCAYAKSCGLIST